MSVDVGGGRGGMESVRSFATFFLWRASLHMIINWSSQSFQIRSCWRKPRKLTINLDTAQWHWGSFMLNWRTVPTFLIWAIEFNCVHCAAAALLGFFSSANAFSAACCYHSSHAVTAHKLATGFCCWWGRRWQLVRLMQAITKQFYRVVVDFCGSLPLQFTAETSFNLIGFDLTPRHASDDVLKWS